MLEVRGNDFYLDGEKFRILSGAIHYFRMPAQRWADSIQKAKLMGLNTIETYIAWNVHEPEPGKYRFDGMYDICGFLEEVKKAGMYAIVRPGPYICAEWDFGGFPYWLLNEPNIRFRCMNDSYIRAVSAWFDKLIPMLAQYQQANGGNIIAMQIENEYGSYGNDKQYLKWLKDKMILCGITDTFFFTSDGYTDFCLQGGTLPEVHKTVNFGSRAAAACEGLRKFQPEGPFMCSEFWNGWFDAWGGAHRGHDRSAADCAKALEEILDLGGSVNFYMFHGGTNLGFSAGTNYDEATGALTPDVTSYDYGAPLDECGDITEKYLAFRETLKKYTNVPDGKLPEPGKKIRYADLQATGSVRLFDALDQISEKQETAVPYNMEYYHQGQGYILYRTRVEGPCGERNVVLQEVRDRALVFADGTLRGMVDRSTDHPVISLAVPPEGMLLDVLVENLARINFGPYIHETKGITEGIRLGEQFLYGFEVYPLTMDHLDRLTFGQPAMHNEPAFYRFELEAQECADTYINMEKWNKGFVTVNGVNIGRYWNIGPQQKLFVPKEFLKIGKNEIVVFDETGGCSALEFAEQ